MKAILVLEDGFCLEGKSFTGAIEFAFGEIACNTTMGCYQEMLTEPAYTGQLLCMTWPLVGNYGINNEDQDSAHVCPNALIVKECCKEPSNWRSVMSVPEYLMQNKKHGVEALDTRSLMVHLRENGTMKGAISTEILDPKTLLEKLKSTTSSTNLVETVTTKSPYILEDNKLITCTDAYQWKSDKPHMVAYDFGIKYSTLRTLAKQGIEVLVVPSNTSLQTIEKLQPQSILLSDGPGNPADCQAEIGLVKSMVEKLSCSIVATGLGFQILATALGAKTQKLKTGRHGVNIPVKILANSRVHIANLNQKFYVDATNAKDIMPTHITMCDGTLQGFKHASKKICGIQHDITGALGMAGTKTLLDEIF